MSEMEDNEAASSGKASVALGRVLRLLGIGDLLNALELVAIPLAIFGIYLAVDQSRLAVAALKISEDSLAAQQNISAWQLLTTPAPGNSGKKDAIEYLLSKNVPLPGIDVGCAYLTGRSTEGDACRNGGAFLAGVRVKQTNQLKPYLVGANLSGANLSSAEVSDANLDNAILDYSAAVAARISSTSFSYASMRGMEFHQASLTDVDFGHADLENTDLSHATFSNAKLAFANVSGVSFCSENRFPKPHPMHRSSCVKGLIWESVAGAFYFEDNPPKGLDRLDPPLRQFKVCKRSEPDKCGFAYHPAITRVAATEAAN